jgi:hypothetical protein
MTEIPITPDEPDDFEERKNSGRCIVAIPTATEPIHHIGDVSEPKHATVLWLGKPEENPALDMEAVQDAVRGVAESSTGPVTSQVESQGLLGDENAQVVHLGGDELPALRENLLAAPELREGTGAVQQFPGYTPHVTLGYDLEEPVPDDDLPEEVIFDRLAVWDGEEHTEYPLGPSAESTIPEGPDSDEDLPDVEFSDVMAIDDNEFNWVEKVGGLPKYIKRIAKHLQEKGMKQGHAIATAVNAVKKACATGDLNFPGVQHENAGSRAKACAAVAEWEEKKARSHANIDSDASIMSHATDDADAPIIELNGDGSAHFGYLVTGPASGTEPNLLTGDDMGLDAEFVAALTKAMTEAIEDPPLEGDHLLIDVFGTAPRLAVDDAESLATACEAADQIEAELSRVFTRRRLAKRARELSLQHMIPQHWLRQSTSATAAQAAQAAAPAQDVTAVPAQNGNDVPDLFALKTQLSTISDTALRAAYVRGVREYTMTAPQSRPPLPRDLIAQARVNSLIRLAQGDLSARTDDRDLLP